MNPINLKLNNLDWIFCDVKWLATANLLLTPLYREIVQPSEIEISVIKVACKHLNLSELELNIEGDPETQVVVSQVQALRKAAYLISLNLKSSNFAILCCVQN